MYEIIEYNQIVSFNSNGICAANGSSPALYHVGFLYDLCYLEAKGQVDYYLTRIDNYYSDVVYNRIDDIQSGVNSAYNTVFVALPIVGHFSTSKLDALSAFVQSGRRKRVVLVGEYNPDPNHPDRSGSPATIYYGVHYTTPAIDASFSLGARCYVSDFSCYVTAVQCSDGFKKWEWSDDDQPMFSSPTVYDGYIFVGSNVNGMYRIIDHDTYAQKPNPHMYTDAGRFINSTAAAWNGKLYFSTESGNVCRIDTTTFATADWTTDLGVGAITSSPLISTPTGLLFTGTDSGAIYVLGITNGSKTLVYDTSQDMEFPTIKSSPAAAGGYLFIIAGNANQRRLYCFGP